MKNIVIIGCGGHSKVVLDIIKLISDYHLVGFYDDNKVGTFCNYPILGKIENLNINYDGYIIGIGNNNDRYNIYHTYPSLNWLILIHPDTIISKNIKIDKGTVVCAGAIIQTEVNIGKHCIINTGCNIDHESNIGNFCSICTGSVICGQVKIDDFSFIGANSTIIQCLNIGKQCIIGAGSVVIRNIGDNRKAMGNPAK